MSLRYVSAEIYWKKLSKPSSFKGSLNFAAQLVEDGAKLEKMTADLREYLRQHPPMTGAFSARVSCNVRLVVQTVAVRKVV